METTLNKISTKQVYTFGNKKAEGNTKMKALLGGKGANLAEMNLIGLPVPPGFTITTTMCTTYNKQGKGFTISLLKNDVEAGIKHIEKIMGSVFGDEENPCLVSVRSGARDSMPGMMDTVLNTGLNDKAVLGLAKKTDNPKFAWDSYRRFIQMFGDVVMNTNAQSNQDDNVFEEIIDKHKALKNITLDQEFSVDDLKQIVAEFKAKIKQICKQDFPEDPYTQLWQAIIAVFDSWETPRAQLYRKLNKIPDDWGTAVNIQAMVYGNMGNQSGSGVAFTRNAATGENVFNGEYLINAQGEDVVSGVRTPQQITLKGSLEWAQLAGVSENERLKNYPSLEESMPQVFAALNKLQHHLELHFTDMQDMEFTIQEGKLWLLQTRNGKRTGAAMVKIAIDMLSDNLIDAETAILRVSPNKLDELLHPVFDEVELAKSVLLGKGLPASPGAASGQIVFFAEAAKNYPKSILVRTETSPEDLEGMNIAQGILTARGGMTSHAAVVARGMGKCCVSGVGALKIDYKTKTLKINGETLKDGDWISLDGSTGKIMKGKIVTKDATLTPEFDKLLKLSDAYAKLKVRTNADTPHDAKIARNFGAQGIGLTRTEHMFFEGERIKAMREMILAADETGRRKALDKLLPMQRADFEGIFEAMHDLPVTIRLLDPPLHEFVPHETENQQEMAQEMGISLAEVKAKVNELSEFNPMLGHRGCRLGNTYPEITEMQTRAIIEAALNLKARGIKAVPEIMVPLIGNLAEFVYQENIIRKTADKVFEERQTKIDYLVGTMIEIPRAALTADKIAQCAEFFSFGTNDLTQMTFGYSRDDAGSFLPIYIKKGILKVDPFQVLDQEGVGQLVEMATQKGRATNPKLKVGICGEHGGEPSSIEFCHRTGLNYVSCSPYRVSIARLAAAQAAITNKA